MCLGWIAFAAQVLAGMPEQAAYCAVATCAWLLTRNAGLGLLHRAGRLILLGVGAAAVAAPQLLPTLAYLPETTRGAPLTGDLVQVAAIAVDRPWQLIIAGTGVLNGIPSFFGVATLALATIAVAARRARAAFLAALAAVAFALATGPATPLYGWLHEVPLFDHFRTPLKLQAMAELALAWVAALGVEGLRAGRAGWIRPVTATLIVAALAERVVYLRQEIPVFRRFAGSVVAPDVVEALGCTTAVRAHRAGEPPPLLLDGRGRYGGHAARSLGGLVGLSSLRGYPVALLGRRHAALLNIRPYDPALATLLGARYLLSSSSVCRRDAAAFQWPVVDETADFCLLQNPVAVTRHELLASVVAVEDEGQMIARVLAHPEGPVPVVAPAALAMTSSTGTIVLDSYESGHARLRTMTAGPALLLVRDSWFPGWRVLVDGTAVAPRLAAGIYFGVPLPAGDRQILLEYRTPGFRAGLAILLAWATGTAGWHVLTRRRRAM